MGNNSSVKPKPWSRSDIPDLSSKICIVTGSTGGIGYETAVGLVQAGASEVILIGRNVDKGNAALKQLKSKFPNTKTILSFFPLDLSSLESIAEFAKKFNEREVELDILINNAGLFPSGGTRKTTKDGFEETIGINHFAHFALTGQLMPSLRKSKSPRIVNVSSFIGKIGKIDFQDLQSEHKPFSQFKLYAQSKLANLLFTFELQRKSDANNWGLIVNAVHPGYVRTDMTIKKPENDESFVTKFFNSGTRFAQEAQEGANSSLCAITSPQGGEYYSPSGFMKMSGQVTKQDPPNNSKDEEVAKQLWQVSEQLTHGVFS